MSKFTEQTVSVAFQPYLQKDEFLTNAAYCGRQRQLLGCLLGPIINAFLTKLYMVGLTNRRVIVIRLANHFGGNVNVAEVRDYPFDRLPAINATFGTFATDLRINDPVKPFRATFASVGVPNNYHRGQMIARELLARWENKGAVQAPHADPEQTTFAAQNLPGQPAQPPAPTFGAHQFGQQTGVVPRQPQQNSGTVYGCLSAALIAAGSGLFLLSALVIVAMILDTKKTTRDTIGGIVGGGSMILFSASLIAVGIYVVRLRRSAKSRAASPQSRSAALPQTTPEQAPPQSRPGGMPEGAEKHSESITIYARDEQTAQSLCNDQYFLLGALMSDGSASSKQFVDALGQGGLLSYDIAPNVARGGYDVRITLASKGPSSSERTTQKAEAKPEPVAGQVEMPALLRATRGDSDARRLFDSALSHTASPVALRVHGVVKEMCAKPGRSFSKQTHAAPLYELLPASQIPKEAADLFVEATTFTAAFTGARTDESRNALEKLCSLQGPVVDNLLHCITQISDADHKVDIVDATGPAVVVSSSQTSKVSFEAQREMARAELKRRGSPEYDVGCYAVAGTPALRLCDPVHLARKELDWVAMIVDQSVQVEMAGDRTAMKVSAPADQLGKALSKLEHAIARCPDDLDLLVAKACILTAAARPEAVGEVLDLVLSTDPTHFEAMTWKNHPATWANALRFPKWDKKSSSLHPVMAAHLALGHRVQVVRNGLQKTLAIVNQVQGPPFDPRTQIKVEWCLSETPHGPLIAYYLKIIEPAGEPSIMEAFLPGFRPTLFSPMEGYFLVQQLAFTPYCFVVLVSGNNVVLNRRIIFEDKAAQKVREVALRLSSVQSYLPEEQFQTAMQWHMNNFDVTKLAFG